MYLGLHRDIASFFWLIASVFLVFSISSVFFPFCFSFLSSVLLYLAPWPGLTPKEGGCV